MKVVAVVEDEVVMVGSKGRKGYDVKQMAKLIPYKITKANMFLIYYLHTAVHSFIAAKLYKVNQKHLQYNQIH